MSDDSIPDVQAWLDRWSDPERSARRAGLHYVSDDDPGIHRKRWGRGFTYLDPEGNHITDGPERERLERLAIPPAWTDVWICPDPEGHLLATGRDDAGRKQYLYHPAWEEVRREVKFNRLIPFGEALSAIRARCEQDLTLPGLSRDKVLALVVTLLDQTLIRVGNAAYARNGSFGLTTLRDRHVDFSESCCVFEFTGKSGKKHRVPFDDPHLATLVQACRDVPGYHLFQYYDDERQRGEVHSDDVNAYLRDTTGAGFTAKDFRTWGGTVLAATRLVDLPPGERRTEAEQHVVDTVKEVADHLGNTPTVCRKYYVHPGVIASYLDGTLHEAWPRFLNHDPAPHLSPAENALLHILRERLFEPEA